MLARALLLTMRILRFLRTPNGFLLLAVLAIFPTVSLQGTSQRFRIPLTLNFQLALIGAGNVYCVRNHGGTTSSCIAMPLVEAGLVLTALWRR